MADVPVRIVLNNAQFKHFTHEGTKRDEVLPCFVLGFHPITLLMASDCMSWNEHILNTRVLKFAAARYPLLGTSCWLLNVTLPSEASQHRTCAAS